MPFHDDARDGDTPTHYHMALTLSQRERLEALHEGYLRNALTPNEWDEYWKLRHTDEEAIRRRLGTPFLRGYDNPWREPRGD
jgi:hypothetical protein